MRLNLFKLLSLLVLLLVQTGCNPFKLFAPDSCDIQSQGWAGAGCQAEKQDDSVFCYNTLGTTQCQAFKSPSDHDKEREVGH